MIAQRIPPEAPTRVMSVRGGLKLRLLPADDETPPSNLDRGRFFFAAVLPWVALYTLTAALHLTGVAFRFAFEDQLPVYAWTALIYQSIYPAVAVAPWQARTRGDLRRLMISLWTAMAVVFPIYWIMPSQAPRRPLELDHWIAQLLQFERTACPPAEAFPSFHVLWAIFLARLWRPAWLGILYAAAIAVSCIATGMHYIPDILAALAVAPFLVARRHTYR
ncbi:MAG TPA: phosphatase PAP2 family protein [Candidatus Sulfotelmatobacter sp.]|nr:phosphatase PAP2 family protein [Candidatus Sulfotelmatobacter sp.]